MGQRQFLTLDVILIIACMATVIGLKAFGVSAKPGNVQTIKKDLYHMAHAAQGYFMKPTVMGGGNRSFQHIAWGDLSGINYYDSSYTGRSDQTVRNAHGSYTMGNIQSDHFTITAVPATKEKIMMLVCADTTRIKSYSSGHSLTPPTACTD